jgi:hypothetical protein
MTNPLLSGDNLAVLRESIGAAFKKAAKEAPSQGNLEF